MDTKRRAGKLVALAAASALAVVGCSSDDEASGSSSDNSSTGSDSGGGGEFIDLGTFVGGPPEHLDPALNSDADVYQVTGAIFDGLTDLDYSDPANPEVVPLVAETVESNDDGTVWTFTIREGAQFSDGEEINASTFQASWERAADLAGDYSYLLTFIEGGGERLGGEADTISGVEADDDSRTLTITLAAPHSTFDAVLSHHFFSPVPAAAIEAGADWETEVMFGNGPYVMEAAASEQEIALVKNDAWQGDFNGDTWDGRVDALVFRVQADPDTGFTAFEAGEGDSARIPTGRVTDAEAEWGTTLDVSVLGTIHFAINGRDERIGGDENLKLRQAISAAIDREEINSAVFNGGSTTATGITPEGIPGFLPDLCEYCSYDPEQAQTLYDEWVAEGGTLDAPIPIQFPAGVGQEPLITIIADNLAAIGIETEQQGIPPQEYGPTVTSGGCVICRAGWNADYPTYDNFMFDLFHSSTLDQNNLGFVNEEFDALVEEAMRTSDKDAQAELFQQAEQLLLNQETMAIPINWSKGLYAYDDARVSDFNMTPQGLILWEQITLTE